MATDKDITITVKEVLALADRLHARGTSVLTAQPEVASDMTIAARAIRSMAKQFNHGDVVTINGDITRSGPTMLRRMTVLVVDEVNEPITADMAVMIATTVEADAAAGGG
jgi:hypothetical protein